MPIVLNRADYYASLAKKHGGDYNKVFAEEIAEAKDDPVEILDWFQDNMNIENMKPYFKLVASPEVPTGPSNKASVRFDK